MCWSHKCLVCEQFLLGIEPGQLRCHSGQIQQSSLRCWHARTSVNLSSLHSLTSHQENESPVSSFTAVIWHSSFQSFMTRMFYIDTEGKTKCQCIYMTFLYAIVFVHVFVWIRISRCLVRLALSECTETRLTHLGKEQPGLTVWKLNWIDAERNSTMFSSTRPELRYQHSFTLHIHVQLTIV